MRRSHFVILLLVFVAVDIGVAHWLVARHKPTTEQTSQEPHQIPKTQTPAPLPQTAPTASRTTLPLRLIGTALLTDAQHSIAAIEDLSQQLVTPLQPGEQLAGKIRLDRIERLKIFFTNLSTGLHEYLSAAGDLGHLNPGVYEKPGPSTSINRGVTKSSETSYQIDHDYLMSLQANVGELLSEARAMPTFGAKGIEGYRLDQIRKGSFFEAIGLKDGDTVEGFNGQDVSDLGRVLTALGEVDRMDSVELNLNRGGRKIVVRYKLR